MIWNRWRMAISQRCIFTTEDGRFFAFPFGPFVAYLLPDAKCRSLVVTAVLSLQVASIPVGVAMIAVIKTYTLPVHIFPWVSILLYYIVLVPLVWSITRKYVRLPIALSVRTCAALQDPTSLWENSYHFTFMTILMTLSFILFSMNPAYSVVPICFLFQALVNWYMVILRHSERTALESFRDKSD